MHCALEFALDFIMNQNHGGRGGRGGRGEGRGDQRNRDRGNVNMFQHNEHYDNRDNRQNGYNQENSRMENRGFQNGNNSLQMQDFIQPQIKIPVPCTFFASPLGCRFGDGCRNIHADNQGNETRGGNRGNVNSRLVLQSPEVHLPSRRSPNSMMAHGT